MLIVQRWILARLRNEMHFSLDPLNARIAELLEDLNDRTMRVYRVSRRQLFTQIERSVLKPLPATRFVYGEWTRAKVNVDYHVEVDGHYYSVPHAHRHAYVDVRVSAGTVEILLDGRRVASHARSTQRGRHTTTPGHMPAAHRAHLEWSPSRIINGPGPSVRRRARWQRRSWRTGHTRSRGTGRAWGSCGWASGMATSGSRRMRAGGGGRRTVVPSRRLDPSARA